MLEREKDCVIEFCNSSSPVPQFRTFVPKSRLINLIDDIFVIHTSYFDVYNVVGGKRVEKMLLTLKDRIGGVVVERPPWVQEIVVRFPARSYQW